jgi:chromosome segregation ATPase
MAGIEDLRKESRELQEKMNDLQHYLFKFREIRQGLARYNYRLPSREPSPDELQRKKQLEKELRDLRRQVRQEHGFGESRIEGVMKKWDSELSSISRRIAYLEYVGGICNSSIPPDAVEGIKVKSYADYYVSPFDVAVENFRKREREQ